MYTEFELRQAIFTALTNPNMPYAWTRGCDESKKLVFPTSLNIEFEYGVPKTTYYTKVVDFKSTFTSFSGNNRQSRILSTTGRMPSTTS